MKNILSVLKRRNINNKFLACVEDSNYAEVLNYLNNKKVNINCTSKGKHFNSIPWEKNVTALHIAVANNNPTMIKLLLEYHPNFQAITSYRSTLLHCLPLYHNNQTNEVIDLLKDNVNVNAVNKDGYTILHEAVLNSYDRVNKILTIPLVNIDALTFKHNKTALYLACKKSTLDIVELLINFRVDIFCTTNKGRNIFHAATKNHKDRRILPYLCELLHGSQNFIINNEDNYGYNPLYFAKDSHIDILLKYGCCANIKSLENKNNDDLILIVNHLLHKDVKTS